MGIKQTLLWGKSTLTLVPGLSPLLLNVLIPNEISRGVLGGLVTGSGVLTLIILKQNNGSLKPQIVRRNKKIAVLLFLMFLLFLFGYFLIYDLQYVYSEKYDTSILIPLWQTDTLKYMVTKSGSISQAIIDYGPQAIRTAINQSAWSLSLTKIAFVIIYVIAFEFLVLSFGVLESGKTTA